MIGTQIDQYRAPLLVAWQLTNSCSSACLACCEESGPDKAWADELSRDECLDITRQIIDAGIPYVAFGGGEPLGIRHSWEIFERLADAGVGIKLETDARHIDAAAADRLAAMPVQCIQVSIDGATAKTHETVRPGSSFDAAIGAIERLVQRGARPQLVFVPTRLNIHEIVSAYDLAERLGCESFVTGPLMRIGRAATHWERLGCDPAQWQQAAATLRDHAHRGGSTLKLAIYPWDIVEEIGKRLESPQAMLLIVPNGRVKLMNALPFAAANLRQQSLEGAWAAYQRAWRSPEVAEFVRACRADPGLLRHANETWPVNG